MATVTHYLTGCVIVTAKWIVVSARGTPPAIPFPPVEMIPPAEPSYRWRRRRRRRRRPQCVRRPRQLRRLPWMYKERRDLQHVDAGGGCLKGPSSLWSTWTSVVTRSAPRALKPTNDRPIIGWPKCELSRRLTSPTRHVRLSFQSRRYRQAQSTDDSLRPVIELLRAGHQPNHADIRQYPEEARVLLAQWDSLLLEGDVLYRRFRHPDGSTDFLQIILPVKLRRPYLEKLHADLGHFGQAKTGLAASRRIYLDGDVTPSLSLETVPRVICTSVGVKRPEKPR